MGRKLSTDELIEKGRKMIERAKQKEKELRVRKLVKLGTIFQREIKNGFPSNKEDLLAELKREKLV